MLQPYVNLSAAEARALALSELTGYTHSVEVAPSCASAYAAAWYVVGPRERVGRPLRVDRRVFGTNKPETWVSDVLEEIVKREHEPRERDYWAALIAPKRRGEDPEAARHTERVALRLSPEHARRLHALAAGDPISRVVERMIDAAWNGTIAE